MYKKKYGRMTVGAWLNMEMEHTNPLWMILMGGGLMVGGMLVRFFVGSPYKTLMTMGVSDIVPPSWLMALLWTVSFLVVGCAAGFAFGYRSRGCEVDKYK
ncbi:MAG: hypothetical protein IKV02_00160, partial [Clostridia bacterium]|nr:hypothetical protein [Clostridia bacterium]